MGINRFKTVLKYKASRDGWTVKDFHRLSDGIGPSITLYKIKNGSCIGGFTSAKWSSTPSHTFANDPSALLFNLALKTFSLAKSRLMLSKIRLVLAHLSETMNSLLGLHLMERTIAGRTLIRLVTNWKKIVKKRIP